MGSPKPVIFISYSHKDLEWLDFVQGHLQVGVTNDHFATWDDRRIAGGADWEKEIDAALRKCSAFVLLVSRHSLTSKFILKTEVHTALEAHWQRGVRIYPILVRDVDIAAVPWLARMNVRPRDAKALALFPLPQREKVMKEIAAEIRGLVKDRPAALATCPPAVPDDAVAPDDTSTGQTAKVRGDGNVVQVSGSGNTQPITGRVFHLNASRALITLACVAIILALWLMPTPVWCSLSSCYADVVRTEEFDDSSLDGKSHRYVRNVFQKYTFNYDEHKIKVLVPKSRVCEPAHDDNKESGENAASKPEVEAKVYDLLTSPNDPLPYISMGCITVFEATVKNHSAFVRIHYSSSDDEPAGSGVMVPAIVRNLTLEIRPPDAMKVLLTPKDIGGTRRSFARLVPAAPPALGLNSSLVECSPIEPSAPGRPFKVDCPDVWLMPEGNYLSFNPFGFIHKTGERFLLCYKIQGWPSTARNPSAKADNEEECSFPPLLRSPS